MVHTTVRREGQHILITIDPYPEPVVRLEYDRKNLLDLINACQEVLDQIDKEAL